MIPELGHLALILALVLAGFQTVLPLAGAVRGRADWMASGAALARGHTLFLFLAYLALTWAFLQDDFSVAYVAQNSNTALPWYYQIAAVWGAHEGSLLLWVLILAAWGAAVSFFSRSLPRVFAARVLGVLGLVSVGFLLFTILTSNPFARLLPAPAEGRDLNPLLQDPGLIAHPPLLYMGYVGFSVAFAFAVAALLGGRLDATWARWSRPWTTVAWLFLTAGISLGSWWAYNELGWGGWWFWDPVENASFMPWLVGTALMHSLAVTEKRGAFRSWTVLLAIFAFALSLLGTFLVRSGVLTSVHSFASDPERGVFILLLLMLVIGGSLLLYAWRAPRVSVGADFQMVSRETALLLNNVLLTVAAATVLIGTLYPLFMDALGMGKISVGPPYFESVFVPLMIPLVLLLGVGPLLRWKGDRLSRLGLAFGIAALLAVLIGVLVAAWWVPGGLASALGVALALWITVSSLQSLWERVRNKRRPLRALAGIPAGIWGMVLAHLGMAMFIVGVTLVSNLELERDVRLAPGESVTLAGYDYRFDGVSRVEGPNYTARRGHVMVSRDGEHIAELWPEKRTYRVQQSPMTDAAIDVGVFRDLYVALGEPLGEQGAWSLRVHYKPFVRWIWGGTVLMVLGGIFAAADRRYRRTRAVRGAEGGA
ncbi:heme lyase CcmF/NrfE family subunit [Alkalilimnicola sp. S0819]|uniref:heme lyase CcmF/NrfE family subunit n=1 Tax=Alkalilimnicola sp. S0819 TaxID=2613922 RepID=UPI0012617C01|nr:heme lyase CcmF/NrfE family subunit [Alkalilimnicola sp. S0819]KAB7627489.1 heme lyase CcmF/NrfE family subunit [Alkalilimnicola sp. S0819]MPQ15642.1 heme lyase CcmF/NrfE family subunit [Alkalilimnicola sp. S0819]